MVRSKGSDDCSDDGEIICRIIKIVENDYCRTATNCASTATRKKVTKLNFFSVTVHVFDTLRLRCFIQYAGFFRYAFYRVQFILVHHYI